MGMTERLRQLLATTKLTQMQIKEGTGVPQTTISRMKRGITPRLDNAEKVLSFLERHAAAEKRAAKLK